MFFFCPRPQWETPIYFFCSGFFKKKKGWAVHSIQKLLITLCKSRLISSKKKSDNAKKFSLMNADFYFLFSSLPRACLLLFQTFRITQSSESSKVQTGRFKGSIGGLAYHENGEIILRKRRFCSSTLKRQVIINIPIKILNFTNF